MKRFFVLFLFIPTLAFAQAQMAENVTVTSLNANAGAAPQTGTAFAVASQLNTVTWNVSFASAPASHTTVLETSNDNSVWVTADTSTNVNGESRTIFTAARFIRTTESARSGGGAITTTIVGKRSPVTNTALNPGTNLAVASIALGTNPAAAGPLRLPNDTYITARNAANSADINMFKVGTGNLIEAGTTVSAGAVNSAAITASGLITANAGVSAAAAQFFSIAGRGFLEAPATNVWRLSNAAGTTRAYFSVVAPTVSSGFCTSPTITNGTGMSFLIDVGSACATGNGVIALNATADNGWHCTVFNVTNNATTNTVQSATTTTTATFQNYVRTTGVAGNWAAGDDLSISCVGR